MTKREYKGFGKVSYHMCGGPYVGVPPSGYMPKQQQSKVNTSSNHKERALFLIDGDNHITEATKNLKVPKGDDRIIIFISQEGLYNKWKKKNIPRVSVKYVKKGDQAVDKRIIATVKGAIESKRYVGIYIVSHDKGYEKFLREYRSRYGLSNVQLALCDEY